MGKFRKQDNTPKYGNGLANIKRGKKGATVTFEDTGDPKLLLGKFTIALEDLDNDRAVGFEIDESALYAVSLDLNKTPPALVSVHPWDGVYVAKVIDFAHAEGKEPAPTTKMVKYGNQSEAVEDVSFRVILQIVSGDCAGAKFSYKLPYKWFVEADDGSGDTALSTPKDPSKATTYQKLEAFLEYAGAEPVKWSDNILPDLLTVVKKAKKTFNIVVQKGWITSLTSLTPVARKASKKSSAADDED